MNPLFAAIVINISGLDPHVLVTVSDQQVLTVTYTSPERTTSRSVQLPAESDPEVVKRTAILLAENVTRDEATELAQKLRLKKLYQQKKQAIRNDAEKRLDDARDVAIKRHEALIQAHPTWEGVTAAMHRLAILYEERERVGDAMRLYERILAEHADYSDIATVTSRLAQLRHPQAETNQPR